MLNCRNEAAYSTRINSYDFRSQCSSKAEYFLALNNQRRDKTFPSFVSNTDEKLATIAVLRAFLDDYWPFQDQNCAILDIGVGEGTLSGKIAEYIREKCYAIHYNGIDRSEKFVAKTRANLESVGINDANIISGNCFTDDLNKLPNNQTLLIASQVVFYALDIESFVDSLIQKNSNITIITGQSQYSFLNEINAVYAANHKKFDTELEVINSIADDHKVNGITFLYSSVIQFPKISSLKKIAFADYEMLIDPTEILARNILEFVAGSPLEYLESMNMLSLFVSDIQTHLDQNNYKIWYWNYMTVIVRNELITQTALKEKWNIIQQQQFTTNMTEFDKAVHEHNYGIAEDLFAKGLVTQVQNYKKPSSYFQYLKDAFLLYIEYSLKFIPGDRLIIESIFGKNFYLNTEFKTFRSDDLQKLHSPKYSFEENNPMLQERYEYYGKEIDIRKPPYIEIIQENYLLTAPMNVALLIVPLVINRDDIVLKFILSYLGIFAHIIYDFSQRADYVVHHLSSLEQQFYLAQDINIHSLDLKNIEGRTSLHDAILANNIVKALNQLKYPNMANISDIHGKSPIHYATQQNNVLLIEKLIHLNVDINAQIYNPIKSLFDNVFLFSKLLFLNTYFAGWIKNADTDSIFQKSGLFGSIYLGTKYLGIKYPENLYYHVSLIYSNQDGVKENYLYRSEIFNIPSFNTPLHISTAFNHSEATETLLTNNANVNVINSYGETPLHFAALNHNADIASQLITKGAFIDHQSITYAAYYYGIFASITTALIMSSSWIKVAGELTFFKILNDDVFPQFNSITSATPLHYATNSCKNQFEVIKTLLDLGADPDALHIKFSYIEYSVMFLAVSLKLILSLNHNPYLLVALLSTAIPFLFTTKVKPIDLIDKNNNQDSYKYLQQYTTLNQYTGKDEIFPFSIFYLQAIAKLGFDRDIIDMQQFGAYKGGSGIDTFIVHHNFIGKTEEFRLIIKDYSEEDILDLKTFFGINNIDALGLRYEELLKLNSTVIFDKIDHTEIVLLLGTQLQSLEELNLVL